MSNISFDHVIRIGVTNYQQIRSECMNVPGADCEAGLELEMLSMVLNLLNLTFEIKHSPESGCGSLVNETWTGLLGMLERNEIDVVGNLCTLDQYRVNAQWLQSSWPVLQNRQNFLIKAPETEYQFANVTDPFAASTWRAVFLSILLFILIFTCLFKISFKYSLAKSFKKSVNDIFRVMFGLDVNLESVKVWISFIYFFGSICTIYSTFIKAAMLKPVIIGKPFKNSDELANVLYKGQYKILDYKSQPFIKCYDNSTCSVFSKAIKRHGFHMFPNSQGPDGTNRLLNELLVHPNLVLIKGRYHLCSYLNDFSARNKLWLFEDETSGEDWSVYFFRKNFTNKRRFNDALIRLDTAKDNLQLLYVGLSTHAHMEEYIKGEIPEKQTIDLNFIRALSVYCGTGLTITCLTFIVELIYFKVTKQCDMLYDITR